jgi:hypothetical protein
MGKLIQLSRQYNLIGRKAKATAALNEKKRTHDP